MALAQSHWAIPDFLLQCAHLHQDQKLRQQGGICSSQLWGMTGSTELWNSEIAKRVWELLTYTATIPIPTAAKCKQVQKLNLTSLIHSQGAETKSKLQIQD